MKWWQIAVLVIAALTLVPCIVLIVIGVMILCFIKKGTGVVLASLKYPCVATYMHSHAIGTTVLST